MLGAQTARYLTYVRRGHGSRKIQNPGAVEAPRGAALAAFPRPLGAAVLSPTVLHARASWPCPARQTAATRLQAAARRTLKAWRARSRCD